MLEMEFFRGDYLKFKLSKRHNTGARSPGIDTAKRYTTLALIVNPYRDIAQ